MSALMSTPPVGERFDNLIISPIRVYHMLGKRSPGEVTFEESEQSNARRELLRVEKRAIKNKFAQAQSHASFIEAVSSELHSLIVAEIQTIIQSPRNVFTQVLALNDDATALIDTLSTRAASISRLGPHAAALPWMHDELLRTVNTPSFRRKDSRGRVIVVESLKTALSFLGIENLRLLIPSLILKRSMPQVTDPYPQVKRKLHQYSIGTALTARELAAFTGVKPYDAFVLGMLSNLGRCALIKLYFRLFDQVQRRQLLESQRNKQREKHDALLHIKPSTNYLIALQNEYANRLTADLFEHMMFRRLAITEPMRAFSESTECDRDTAPDVLSLAQRYTRIRMLRQHRFIEKEEAKRALRMRSFPTGAVDRLKAIDIFALPMISEQERTQQTTQKVAVNRK